MLLSTITVYSMKISLTIAFIGNLIDMVSTLYLTQLGYQETNPIMRELLNYPILFIAVKIGVMTSLLCHLWQQKTDKHAKLLATIAVAAYGGISIYYGIFFAVLI